jgi:hypothetical protein
MSVDVGYHNAAICQVIDIIRLPWGILRIGKPHSKEGQSAPHDALLLIACSYPDPHDKISLPSIGRPATQHDRDPVHHTTHHPNKE